MKDQLEVTCYFISLLMCSTCFGHLYIHHQELAPLKTSRTKSPTHNELRTRRPMW